MAVLSLCVLLGFDPDFRQLIIRYDRTMYGINRAKTLPNHSFIFHFSSSRAIHAVPRYHLGNGQGDEGSATAIGFCRACSASDGDQQADSLVQDVQELTINDSAAGDEQKPQVEEKKPAVSEAAEQTQKSHQRRQPTIVCDAWYGLPTQKRPRRERVNAIARQLRNVEQSALLANVANSRRSCGARVVLVGKESDVQVIGERLEKLREEDGGKNIESSSSSSSKVCKVELLPNISVEEACGTALEADGLASADDTNCHDEADQAIYLSPDAETTLDPRQPPPRTVVVGMLIDRRVQPNRSSERAEKIAIPAARLPMDELKVEGLETNEALNVDTVLEMMVSWWDKVDRRVHVGNDDDDDGTTFRRCFIAAASAAMVSHEDRHPNRAIHGTGS